jgi:hypothetical protein
MLPLRYELSFYIPEDGRVQSIQLSAYSHDLISLYRGLFTDHYGLTFGFPQENAALMPSIRQRLLLPISFPILYSSLILSLRSV